LGIWDTFIKKCDVTVVRTVAEDEVVFAGYEVSKEYIDFGLKPWADNGLIKIVDVEPLEVKAFYEESNIRDKYDIHPGETESLAFLGRVSEDWKFCSSEGPAFAVLGFLGKSDQGISLEETLQMIGLTQSSLEREYTKKFREKYARVGQIDSVQSKGLYSL
jgi:hypothetical protein